MCGETRMPRDTCAGNILPKETRIPMTLGLICEEYWQVHSQRSIFCIADPTYLESANQKIESHKFFLQLLQYVGCAEVFLKPP